VQGVAVQGRTRCQLLVPPGSWSCGSSPPRHGFSVQGIARWRVGTLSVPALLRVTETLKKDKIKKIMGQLLKCALNWCNSDDFSEVTEICTS